MVVAAVVVAVIGAGVLLASRNTSTPLAVGPTPAAAGQDRGVADPVDAADFAEERLPPVEVVWERQGDGPLLPGEPVDLTLVAIDEQGLALIDTDSGRRRRITVRRPSRASLSDAAFMVGGGLVIGADADVVVLPQASPRPRRIAAGHSAVPTFDDASVWVFDDASRYVTGTASRVGLDGGVRAQVQLPAVAEPLAGTADGLVVGTPASVAFVGADGTRRTLVRGAAVATDGRRLAWLECAGDLSCAIAMGTIDDPDQVRTALAPDVLPAGFLGLPTGAFSPDGRWLAVPLYSGGVARDVTVSVIDTSTGIEAFRADGARRNPFTTPLAWSPDSGWLFFVSGADLKAWRAGDRQATTVDVDVRDAHALTVR